MEPQENNKKNLKPLLVILFGIVLIGLTGFGVWYVENKEMQKQKSDSGSKITALQKQLNESKTTTTTKPVATKSTRNVDFSKVIKVGEGSTISDTQYADYNNDGQEEALVTITVNGTGGYKEFYVYGYKDNIITKYLAANTTDLKDAYGEGYNGHDKMEFSAGKLVLSHPIYKPTDPNCCPSGGTKYIYFKWSGSIFVIEKQETK